MVFEHHQNLNQYVMEMVKQRAKLRDANEIVDAIMPTIAFATIYISIGPFITSYYFYVLIGSCVLLIISLECWRYFENKYNSKNSETQKMSQSTFYQQRYRRRRSHSLTPSIEGRVTTVVEKERMDYRIKKTVKRRTLSFNKYFTKRSSEFTRKSRVINELVGSTNM
uniref:Uncharacterized protein n=1 Tax=Clytia hemisphaerica TaxID=252671 RepID=A0A7M5VHA2_9CNID|eukprot:TCONS_00027332-protein